MTAAATATAGRVAAETGDLVFFGALLESTGGYEHPRVAHDLKVRQVRPTLCHVEHGGTPAGHIAAPVCVAGREQGAQGGCVRRSASECQRRRV
jgi:hypothetical protein